MNLVQRVKCDQVTFGDVATTVLSMALMEGAECDRIDVVFDTYRGNSIKNCERIRIGESRPSAGKNHRHAAFEAVEAFCKHSIQILASVASYSVNGGNHNTEKGCMGRF